MRDRRQFIQHSAAGTAALAFPLIGGAQPKPVKVGILHPVRWPTLARSAARAR